jgi:TRAP-type C4-dicarboxylate transport system substrate-binding protein
MFAWSGDGDQIEIMKALGYQPVVLETADILPGLQTGMINAAPVTSRFALTVQIDQVASHMLDLRWVPIVGATILSRHAWDQLTPAGREALRAAAAKGAVDLRVQRDALDREAIEVMKKRGLKVESITPEQQAEWQKLAEAVYPKIRGTMVPADLFDQAQRAVADYRRTARKEEK